MLVSRAPFHGPLLYKILSDYYDVSWVGRTIPLKFSCFNILYILCYEFWEVFAAFRKSRAPVILVQFISLDGLVALIFKRLFRSKMVLFAIGSDVLMAHNRGIAYPLIRKIIEHSDAIFCVSTSIQNNINRICTNISKVKVIPSIVDFSAFEKYNGRKEYDIITIGTLDNNKNHEFLLSACQLLSHPVKVLIVGDGPTRGRLEMFSKKYNLDVNFIGIISHKKVFEELQKARIYVHTSRSEGLPVAVLEAIFSGLPVILVKSQYVNDVRNRHGLFVHVVNNHFPSSLANKITDILQNYEQELFNVKFNKDKIAGFADEIPKTIRKELDSIQV